MVATMVEKSYSGQQIQKAYAGRWNPSDDNPYLETKPTTPPAYDNDRVSPVWQSHVWTGGHVEPKTYGRGKSMAGAFLVGIDYAKIEQRYVDMYVQAWINETTGIRVDHGTEVEQREWRFLREQRQGRASSSLYRSYCG